MGDCGQEEDSAGIWLLLASCLRELLPFFEQSSEFEEVVEETPDVVKETI